MSIKKLTITENGKIIDKFTLEKGKFINITIGRSQECDIKIENLSVSKKHLIISQDIENNLLIKDLGSTNCTYINGKKIDVNINFKLKTEDIITLGKRGEIKLVIDDDNKDNSIITNNISPISLLKDKAEVIIGRAQSVDIVINDNIVSRKHAKITTKDGSYYIEDLKSTNGTFVNGKKISQKQKILKTDEIRIGLSIIYLSEGEKDNSTTIAIKAMGVSKKYSNGYIGLQKMDIEITTKSFVALMGPSGCGKTTLLNILNGANPATTGNVLIHGMNLKNYYGLIKQKIGYVPQDDIVHKDLSVDDSLYYAAKLRMNEDTTESEIKDRINQVLSYLNINDKDIRLNKIKDLSGGQRKRVSIAVELLNRPSILFLDEPTSPLDPETIEDFLNILQNLTKSEGTTIVMVTHKPEDLNYVDKVIFLANKGHIAYHGDVVKVYDYFNVEEKSINKIYSLMSHINDAEKWYKKWQNKTENPTQSYTNNSQISEKHNYSKIRQYYWLTRRYFHIKINDKLNLSLLFAQPIVIAILLSLIFDKFEVGVIFLMAISSIWFGVSNSAKEIVDEIPIYTRERMYNLKIITYLLSKITVLSAIAFIQVSLFVVIVSIRYAYSDITMSNEILYILLMFLLAFSATLLGLLLSAMFKTAEKVMTVVPITLLPQIMLSGVITSLNSGFKDLLSYFTLGRWGTEALSRIQQFGDDVEITNKTLLITNKSVEPFLVDTVKVIDTQSVSVIRSIPAFHTATDTMVKYDSSEFVMPYKYEAGMKYEKTDPMNILNFYNDHTLGLFNSLSLNILAILIISGITFVAIIYLLNKKDSIKVN